VKCCGSFRSRVEENSVNQEYPFTRPGCTFFSFIKSLYGFTECVAPPNMSCRGLQSSLLFYPSFQVFQLPLHFCLLIFLPESWSTVVLIAEACICSAPPGGGDGDCGVRHSSMFSGLMSVCMILQWQ